MNLIIPMAGRGTRLRPQTLITPKPLIEIAGKTIVQRIVDVVTKNYKKPIKNIGFIIEKPNVNIEKQLHRIAKNHKICAHIFYQYSPQGTAHAIYSAKSILKGKILVVFADTLFETRISIPQNVDGCVFVKEVEDPRAYGVIKLNSKGEITNFIEKPKTPVSNLAIVGIYYFKEGLVLANEIEHVIENKITMKGEYQITTVLENLKNKQKVFTAHKIDEWYDFGSPKNMLDSHSQILKKSPPRVGEFQNSQIIPPCYVAQGAVIKDSVIGPNVSIGPETKIESSNIKNSIIQSNSFIMGADLDYSIIGSHVEYNKNHKSVNIGDYSSLKTTR